MKRWMMLLIVVLAMAPVAHADEASKKVKVEELFATMHMERMMNQLMDAMTVQVKQMTESMPGSDQLTDAQRKMVNEYQDKAMAMAREVVGWKVLEPQYATLYAKTFNEEELDGIIAFYKSAAGQSMLEKTPQLTAGSMQIVQTKMVDFQPKLKALIDEMTKALSKTSPGAAPASQQN